MKPSARRGLAALILVTVAVAGCGDDDPGTDQVEAQASTATTEHPEAAAREDLMAGLTEGLLSGGRGVIDPPEAWCMANAMIEVVGVGRLVAVADDAKRRGDPHPLASLTPSEQDAAVAAMLRCVPPEEYEILAP